MTPDLLKDRSPADALDHGDPVIGYSLAYPAAVVAMLVVLTLLLGRRLPLLTSDNIGDELSAKKVNWAWYSGGWDNAAGNNGRDAIMFRRRATFRERQEDFRRMT